jgi:CheY-like chemotaxis protein
LPEPRPLIMVADDDPLDREALRAALLDLEPLPDFLEASTIESLVHLVQQREVDLLTLDVSFSGSDRSTREGIDALAVLVQQHPRIPVILVSGNLNIRMAGQVGQHEQVRAVLDKGQADLLTLLPELAAEAIAWGREQRRQADAVYEKGLRELAGGNPVEAARRFIESFETGDLSLGYRSRLGDDLGKLLLVIEPYRELRIRAFETLMKNAYNNQDEMGLIAVGRRYAREYPEKAVLAHEYLLKVATLGQRIDAVIDERLELARLHLGRGNLERVLAECAAIQDKVSDVVDSYLLQIDALKRLGRRDEAIEACFELAGRVLMNGQLRTFAAVHQEIMILDVEGRHGRRLEDLLVHLDRLREHLQGPQASRSHQVLTLCERPVCQEMAEQAHCLYRVRTDGTEPCSLCSRPLERPLEALANRTLAVIGGRFPEAYRKALLDMGAGTVWVVSDGDGPDRVSEAIARADGVLLVTGRVSETCVIRARRELARAPRPTGQVQFYGVYEVMRGVLYDLVPKVAEATGS